MSQLDWSENVLLWSVEADDALGRNASKIDCCPKLQLCVLAVRTPAEFSMVVRYEFDCYGSIPAVAVMKGAQTLARAIVCCHPIFGRSLDKLHPRSVWRASHVGV